MRRCQQVTAADWLVRADASWSQLVSFGPPVFEAYARLRYIPDPEHAGQAENDVVLPADHVSDLEQARRALRRLAGFTATPDECFFCEWDGFGGDWFDANQDAGSFVEIPPSAQIPARRYGLFTAPLSEIENWGEQFAHDFPPAFVWPADQNWCFASDIDPHWAGIGAARAVIDALIRAPDLDIVEADPTEAQPTYY
jgi:hypothetical protein